MTLQQLKSALAEAAKCPDEEGLSNGPKHQKRSRNWVECLGNVLRKNFEGKNDAVRVFTKHHPGNSVEFSLNELLYDVCVCQTATLPTLHAQRGDIRYVTRALWLIESEFDDNIAEAIKDFSKLVIGAAENKLFVGPRSSDISDARFRERLLPVAQCCLNYPSANVLLAHVPHPADWGPAQAEVTLWKLAGAQWAQLMCDEGSDAKEISQGGRR